MPLKGATDATTALNIKSSIDLQPTELKINPSGKVVINLPGLKIHLPDVKMKLWFMPLLRISGIEICTEPASLEVDLNGTSVQGKIERTTRVDLLTSGDVKARATLEGSGNILGGPISLEIPAD